MRAEKRDDIDTWVRALVAEAALRGRTELKAIASPQHMPHSPFDENEFSFEHPDDLAEKSIGGSRHFHARARGQGHMHEIERHVGGRRNLPPNIAAFGIDPHGLIGPSDEPALPGLRPGHQGGDGEAERAGQLSEQVGRGAALPGFDLGNHRPGDRGTFRQLDDFWYFTGLELPSSMLVLDADPLVDIKNPLEIDRVMQAGTWLDRAELLPGPST